MSVPLRKCLDITPAGVILPGAPNDYRRLRVEPWWPALRRTTSTLRLHADWPALQPVRDVDPWSPENPGHASAVSLDEQIRLATEDGLDVMLVPSRYPGWANGTAHLVHRSDADASFQPWDRLRWEFYRPWLERPSGPKPGMRESYYRAPDEGHGPDTAWGRFVAALWDRYVARAPAHGRLAYFEVHNEPNFFLWPQRGPAPVPADPDASDLALLEARFAWEGTAMVAQRATAQMMQTVDALARRHGSDVLCLAPSTADTDDDFPRTRSVVFPSPYATSFDPFVDRLLDELDRVGFAGGDHWGWAYHNYGDMEGREDRAQLLRARLAGRWRGRSLDGGAAIYATEGGVRLSGVRRRFGAALSAAEQRRLQAEVIREAVTRYRDTPDGAGIAMIAQYTAYSDPNFNCGLLEPWSAGGAPRPALEMWSSLEEAPAAAP